MASPSAAWRPWPTCSGPVGLAETNSTSTERAHGRLPAEGRALAQHLGHHRLLGGGCQAQVDEARAGDLEALHPALCGRRGRAGVPPASAAISRGFFFRLRASGMAAVMARSPCAATLGDSKALGGAVPGAICSSTDASADCSSCLAWIMQRFYFCGIPAPAQARGVKDAAVWRHGQGPGAGVLAPPCAFAPRRRPCPALFHRPQPQSSGPKRGRQ